jgi:CHASE2 domain-containing sensor protein
MQNRLLDALLYTRSTQPAQKVRLVTIDDQDYQTYFQSHSPLQVDNLEKIIQAVAAAQPRMIVVDIDTSDPAFAKMRIFNNHWVIWNADATARDINGSPAPTSLESAVFTLHPPLGGVGGRAPGSMERIALSASQTDEHGYIRDFLNTYEVEQPATRSAPPAFSFYASPAYQAALIDKALKQDSSQASSSIEDQPIPRLPPSENVRAFVRSYTVPQYHARDILNDQEEGKDSNRWEKLAFFKDQVVVIGGTYRAARDEDFTDSGPLPGCEVIAILIEEELQKTSIALSAGAHIAWIIALSGSLCLGLKFQRQRNERARAASPSRLAVLRASGVAAAGFLLIALVATTLCNLQLKGSLGQGALLFPTVCLALYLEIFSALEILIALREFMEEGLNRIFWLKPSLKSESTHPTTEAGA